MNKSLDNLDNISSDGCYDICTTLAIDIQSLNVLLLHFTPNDKKSPESKAKLSKLLRSLEKFSGLDYPYIDASKLKQDAVNIKRNFKDFLNRPSESYRDNLTRLLDDLAKIVKDVMNQISPSLKKKPVNRRPLERRRSTESSTNLTHKSAEVVASGVIKLDQQFASRDLHAIDFAFKYAKKWANYCKEVVSLLEKRASYENELSHSMMKQIQLFKNSVSPMTGVLLHSELLNWSHQASKHYKDIEVSNTKRGRELLEVLSRQYVEFENISRHMKERWKNKVKTLNELDTVVHRHKTTYHQRSQDLLRLRKELALCSHQLSTESNPSTPNMQHSGIEIDPEQTLMQQNASQKNNDHSAPAKNTATKVRSNTSTCSSSSLASSNALGSAEAPSTANQNKSASSSVATPPQSNASTPSVGGKSNRLTRMEKLEKQIQDAEKKEQEALHAYKDAVEKANMRLADLDRIKTEILCDIRLHTKKSDEVFKDTLSEYFSIFSQIRQPILETTQSLSQQFQDFVPGSEYQKLIDEHIDSLSTLPVERFSVEEFTESSINPNNHNSFNTSFLNFHGLNNQNQNFSVSLKERPPPKESPFSLRRAFSVKPRAWSFTEKSEPNLFSKSNRDASNVVSRVRPRSHSRPRPMSTLEKHFNLDLNNWRSDSKSSSYNMEGSDLNLTKAASIVYRCVRCIENHPEGLTTQGIYRVPVSKSRVSVLMEKLKVSANLPDLQEETPLTLASILKKTLINMDEPLLTYSLYNKFIEIGRIMDTKSNNAEIRCQLLEAVSQLPDDNKRLASILFHHLKRISDNHFKNQMTSLNLATLFGPTLLRSQSIKGNNLQELTDNSAQIRIVQYLIDDVLTYFPHEEPIFDNDSRLPISAPCTPGDNVDCIFGNNEEKTGQYKETIKEDFMLPRNSDSIRRRTRSVILDYSSGNTATNPDCMIFDLAEYKYIDADSDFYNHKRNHTKSMPSLWPDIFTIVQNSSSFTGTSYDSEILTESYAPLCDKPPASPPATEYSFEFSDSASYPLSNKYTTRPDDKNTDSASNDLAKSYSGSSPSSRSIRSRSETVDVYFEEDDIDAKIECRERPSLSEPLVLSESHYKLASPRALPTISDFNISGTVVNGSSNTLSSSKSCDNIIADFEEEVFLVPESSTAENSQLMTKKYLASVSNTMSFGEFNQEEPLMPAEVKLRLSRSRSQFEDEPVSIQSSSKDTTDSVLVATPSSPNLSASRYVCQSEACDISEKHKTLPRRRPKLKIFPFQLQLSGGHKSSASKPVVARMSSSRYSIPDSVETPYQLVRHYSANSTPPPHLDNCLPEMASTPESVENDQQSKRIRAPQMRHSINTVRNNSSASNACDIRRLNSDRERRHLFRGLKPKSKNPEFV